MKNLNNKKAAQILQASLLGTIAYQNGMPMAPCLNKELDKMIALCSWVTPQGEASSMEIMKAYTKAWTAAHISAKWEVFTK